MTSTHLNLNYHIIFSTKERRPLIAQSWRPRLHSYLGGILNNLKAIPDEIGGTADHVHLLAGLKATHRLADVLRDLKACSSEWIHRQIGCRLFSWQEGYGAFSVCRSDLERIRQYIRDQEKHHHKFSFRDEYRTLLKEFGIEINEDYLW